MTRYAALLLALVLLAGCGGGEEASATEQWADGVCSAISDWRDAVTTAAESIEGGGGAGLDERLETAITDVQEATQNLADDVQDLGPPETEAGEEAQDVVDTLTTELEENVDDIRAAAEGTEGVSATLTAVSTITAALATMTDSITTAFAQLQGLDASTELSDAFDNSESCEALR